ncbi:THAP domain-containing protein 5-like [Diretmus argenteus]
MPKYCSVPSCKNDSGNSDDRKSFYKFPLHDPDRLQQWLRNMGREDWTPSRHQYICHEHFTASCFKVRWGIRYLENDAVPTVFQVAEKRKGADQSERKSKRLRGGGIRVTSPDEGTPPVDGAELDGGVNTVHLYEITVDPSQPGETTVLVEAASDVVGSLHATLDPPPSLEGFDAADPFPVTLFQTVDDLSCLDGAENTEVVLVSECPADGGREELVNGFAATIMAQNPGLLLKDSALGLTDEAPPIYLGVEDIASAMEEPSVVYPGAPVIAYFETIPNVLPSSQFTVPPDTVLSSALSSKPITSTLPIVSKHTPASLVLTMERLDAADGVEGDQSKMEEDGAEQQENQLEEHCYHKNSLSKEQLEAIVCELQKKVKVLQQRHRRHLEKLLGLENTVSQLRQSNLLNEERLQLLERAYIQTSAAVTDAGETVAIIYEEDNAAYLYTLLNGGAEEV